MFKKHPEIRRAIEASLKDRYPCKGFVYEARFETFGEGEEAEEIIDVNFCDPDEYPWGDLQSGEHKTCWSVWGKSKVTPEQHARLTKMGSLFLNRDGTITDKLGDVYIEVKDGKIISTSL